MDYLVTHSSHKVDPGFIEEANISHPSLLQSSQRAETSNSSALDQAAGTLDDIQSPSCLIKSRGIRCFSSLARLEQGWVRDICLLNEAWVHFVRGMCH